MDEFDDTRPPVATETRVSEPDTGRSALPLVVGSGAVALLVGLLGFLLFSANGEVTDLESRLAETESELTATADEVATLTGQLADAADESAVLEEQVGDLQSSVSSLESEIVDIDAAAAGFMARFARESGVTSVQADCVGTTVVEAIGSDELLRFLTQDGDEPPVEFGFQLIDAASECGIENPFSVFGGTAAVADTETLETLATACSDGDGAACDELYYVSPAGSEYERLGLTCGDRFTIFNAPFSCEGQI